MSDTAAPAAVTAFAASILAAGASPLLPGSSTQTRPSQNVMRRRKNISHLSPADFVPPLMQTVTDAPEPVVGVDATIRSEFASNLNDLRCEEETSEQTRCFAQRPRPGNVVNGF
jgi:hypothetical protein